MAYSFEPLSHTLLKQPKLNIHKSISISQNVNFKFYISVFFFSKTIYCPKTSLIS